MTPEEFVEKMCTENKSLNVYIKHVIAETARYIIDASECLEGEACGTTKIGHKLIKACEVES